MQCYNLILLSRYNCLVISIVCWNIYLKFISSRSWPCCHFLFPDPVVGQTQWPDDLGLVRFITRKCHVGGKHGKLLRKAMFSEHMFSVNTYVYKRLIVSKIKHQCGFDYVKRLHS
jgi:hypothetical protein